MKLDLSKLKRVTPIKSNSKSTTAVVDDKFEADAVRRLQQLDDWQDPQPDDSGFAFTANPKELSNDLYDTIHNYDPDDTDTYVGSITKKAIYETTCPELFIIVPKNKECLCGALHR